MPPSPRYRPAMRHALLGGDFYDIVEAARFPQHVLRFRNDSWASRVGLETLTQNEWIDHFGRFKPLPDSYEKPLALRYHGHQFRSYNPYLGDGRGFLFAQLEDLRNGRLLDLGTKGSGRTPWSRQGDGRLTLKGGVREVLATTMLEALGVETSKSFSLIETGEALERGDEPSPTRSSVLVRLSHSHIRIGSFQRFLFLGETENIVKLLDYTLQTYMPHLWSDALETRVIAFLEEVCRRVARTGAQWMLAGFVHGVLNTDNINVTGESFDYGPWRFLPVYDPGFTAAYFDETGLYAFGRQPDSLIWNLARFAECFLAIAPREHLETALGTFEPALQKEFMSHLLWRLGLSANEAEANATLARSLWTFLHESRAPFEQVFFDLRGGLADPDRITRSPSHAFYEGAVFAPLREALAPFASSPDARLDHRYFQRQQACTMLIDEVEALWAPIAETDDWSRFEAKITEIGEMADAYGTVPAMP
jgi:uncharacterized protein YdiU (UPF0061 family)